jgi:TadE-like protein
LSATLGIHGERGSATLETTLMILVLLPLLFGILEFGDALQRWLAQDAAAVQAARYAAELGGDAPEVRSLLADALRSSGIDPARALVEVEPSRVAWRQPIRVTVRTEYPIAVPFLFTTALPLRSAAVARGEVDR